MSLTAIQLARLDLRYYALDHVTVGPWWNYREVTSPFTRLFYILDGRARLEHSGTPVALRPDTLVLAPPFVPVTYHCARRCDNVFVIFTCQVDPGAELFARPLATYAVPAPAGTETRARRLVALNPALGLHEVDPEHPRYNAYLWHAQRGRPSAAAQLESQGLLRILLAPFLAHLEAAPVTPSPHRLHGVLRYIDAHLHQPLPLRHLADVAKLHPTYLSDLFARLVGLRPTVYINRKRVEKAQLLLVTTDRAVKRVAYEVGYHDANYFSRLFKQQTGLSPLAYRRQHR